MGLLRLRTSGLGQYAARHLTVVQRFRCYVSYWLAKKKGRRWALRSKLEHSNDGVHEVRFEVFEPEHAKDVQTGTVDNAKARCLRCGTVMPAERVRSQLRERHGGADVVFDKQGKRIGGACLTAVVTLRPGGKGRQYRAPTTQDYVGVRRAYSRLSEAFQAWESSGKQRPFPVPDEPLPPIGTLGFRVQRYGMLQWANLFYSTPKGGAVDVE